ENLNEFSTAYVESTDTSGLYSNSFLLQQINTAQKYITSMLMKYKPEWYLKSSSATVTASVITLPGDFGYVRELKDENGYKVEASSIQILPVSGGTGTDNMYYHKGNTFVLNKSGVNKTYTLWYISKPREIHHGKATAGGALSITLATDGKLLADYYNGMTIENRTKAWVDVIDDYTAARIATISETAASNDWYGIVPELPEPFHHLIAPRASMTAKAKHPASQENPTKDEVADWINEVFDTYNAWAGAMGDESPEDIWTDFGMSALDGITIPDQGYTIW
ncbi:hypothetical protein LCGC14_1209050, partial [marine sediment metagenome]